MNENKIKELLEKYFDGTTNIDEERLLHQYFNGENVCQTLKVYIPLFMFFDNERKVEPKMPEKQYIGRNFFIGLGIAASIAILFMIKSPGKQTDTFTYFVDGQRIYDQNAAIELVESNLHLLAASMQKMQQDMVVFDKISESYRQVEEKFGGRK
jgi:hypothetical protein